MEDAGQAELGGQAEQSGDVAMRQRALEGDGLVEGGEDDAVLEDGADGVDHGRGDFGEVGEGFVGGYVCPHARFFSAGWPGGWSGWG